MRTITIVNQAATVNGADLDAAVAAVQAQIDQDFAPVWGTAAKLLTATALPTDPHDPGGEAVFVLDDTDQAGALGYHLLTPQGWPRGYVFARTARVLGEDWSLTLSHEVLEQLVDPWASYTARTTDAAGSPVDVMLEVADPCEAASYARSGAGQPPRPVSDFVYPGWFRRGPVTGPLDRLGLVQRPLQLLPGGYIAASRDLSTWQQVFGERVAAHRRLPHPLSRVGRRLLAAPAAASL